MTNRVRLLTGLLAIGLLGAAAPAVAEENNSLQEQFGRLMQGTADDMKARANEMSRILREQLESMMDENGNIIIQGPWPWQSEKELMFKPREEPFGGEAI